MCHETTATYGWFDYDAPIVSGITPPTVSTSGGKILTIMGSNFGVTNPTISLQDRDSATCTCENQSINKLFFFFSVCVHDVQSQKTIQMHILHSITLNHLCGTFFFFFVCFFEGDVFLFFLIIIKYSSIVQSIFKSATNQRFKRYRSFCT